MRISNHIKSAVSELSQHNRLSHELLTTTDFGKFNVCLFLPTLPRDKFKINTSVFSRVSPMIFPTYGFCKLVTNFHSVTYSQVWKDFDIFVTGGKYRGTVPIYMPVVSMDVLYSAFTDSSKGFIYSGDASSSNNDIIVQVNSTTTNYYFLTPKGRYFRDLLSSLGYPFAKFFNLDSSTYQNKVFSLLPLLSFFKVYSDYYESRQYSNTSVIREILKQAFNGLASSYFTAGSSIDGLNTIELTDVRPLFDNLKLLFESDYFTSAQSYPNIVGGSQGLSFSPIDQVQSPFYNDFGYNQSNNNTSFLQPTVAGSSQVYQFSRSHRILENFENIVRRYNLVGAREIDRIRASFGIKPQTQRNQYSVFEGGFSTQLQVQDVTSTSSNLETDMYLGSYSGKGIMSNDGSISIDSDDFGCIIGLSFIQVTPLYLPGYDREVLKTTMFSYYNPDFDHGYAQAIGKGEVQSYFPNLTDNSIEFGIFGYQNSYDEYRQKVSRVSGDFTDNDLLPWSFVRESVGTDPVAQTDDLIYYQSPNSNTDGSVYNDFQRVFVDGSNRDHFYLQYGFKISALRPVRTTSESFDLGVGNVSTNNNPAL